MTVLERMQCSRPVKGESQSVSQRVVPKQVSAGNQLYHVVVDDDEIATRITSLLAADRAGRVTFVPLNRMRPQPVRGAAPCPAHASRLTEASEEQPSARAYEARFDVPATPQPSIAPRALGLARRDRR